MHQEWQYCRTKYELTTGAYLGGVVWINAMNPKLQGILVSLKPTEEGPLGKAEIPVTEEPKKILMISPFSKWTEVFR